MNDPINRTDLLLVRDVPNTVQFFIRNVDRHVATGPLAGARLTIRIVDANEGWATADVVASADAAMVAGLAGAATAALVAGASRADKRTGIVQRQACVDDLIEWLLATGVDVVILDPLIKAHKCEENSNDDMDEVMVLLKEVAIRANVAVWLVHHSSKAGTTVDSTGSRGATAIVGATRVCETMTRPTADEKAKFGLDANVVRLDSIKSNLAAVNEHTMWLRLDGVAVGNPSAVFPIGDFRQVMTLIQPQGINERMEQASFDAVCAELRKLPPKKVWAKAKQNKDTTWVGVPFMAASYPEPAAKLLVKEWVASGLLREIEVTHEEDRRKYWELRLDEITAKKRDESIP